MKKFFVPSSFGKGAETLKFTPIRGNLSAPTNNETNTKNNDIVIKAKKKKKKLTKSEKKQKANKNGAPLTQQSPAIKSKVKTGRIEKKSTQKKKDPKILQLTAALAKAAEQALSEQNASKKQGPASKGAAGNLVSMQNKFKEELKGGKFRLLNEQLYTMNSKEAEALFAQDQHTFEAYHAGYRHQVEKWPLNPLDRIIKTIRKLPKALEIADFGCGEGRLAQSVPNKVYSMDLVSVRDDIIACNIVNTPLQPESVDVAVYCLSLMGTNLKDYILEANRVLRPGGFLYIAEIESRFEDVRLFIKGLQACGFDLIKKDLSVKIFHFFHFKKSRNVGKVAIIPDFTLKPCLYKKR